MPDGRQRRKVIFGDVDDFKSFNEKWGHSIGDAVLQEIAGRFKTSLRTSDFLGRIGGDEFLAILPGINPEGLRIVAERVRDEIAKSPLTMTPEPINGTLSLGAVVLPPKVSTIKEILTLTRSALKTSKNRSKNRVTLLEDLGK